MAPALKRPLLAVAALAAAALAVTVGLPAAANPPAAPPTHAAAVEAGARLAAACGTAGGSGPLAHCLAVVRSDRDGAPLATPAPTGYGPPDLVSAYRTPGGTAGQGHTVAIVDAFDDPNAEADLAAYRAQYGLPPCTARNGCFRKVDQRGGTAYPAPDAGWAIEISLDVDMVSAICPACHILLVEADDNALDNLGPAVNQAAAMGATEISNSYGSVEFPEELRAEAYYNHPGVAVVAASGDAAYGVEYPAASRYVTAAGGTTLTRAPGTSRGWSERAWDGAGSGCSAFVAKPAWQHDALCPTRTVADVAAVADPNTGVAVYDTYGGVNGWISSGGTSTASPIIAAVYALGGHRGDAGRTYAHAGGLFDVTGWANGYCGTYLCTAIRGYDGPTGLGSPNGTGAF